MAKLPAPVHSDGAAEQANSAIEDGEGSELEKYITVCAECESIAVQIHPSYEKQYVNVAAMMSMPPAIVNSPITAQCLVMRKKKEIFKDMQARLEGQSTKDASTSASKPSCDSQVVRTLLSKHRKRSKGRRKLHQVKLRRVLERERKKELQGTPGQKTTNGF